MTIVCVPINSVSTGAQANRQAFSALLANGTGRPLGAQPGVSAGHAPVITATSTTYSFGAGAFVADPAFTTTQGPYLISNDATVTGPVTAAGGTARIDALDLRVDDTDMADGSGARAGVVVYTAGTASAPALAARSVRIATINMPASGGGSPTVSMQNQFAVAAGGLLPQPSSTQRDALITAPYDGFPIYRTDSNNIEVYNGAAWDAFRPNTPLIQRGQISGTFSAQNAIIGTLTFPTPFLTAPTVIATVQVGGNLDVNFNWTGAATLIARVWRIFQNNGVNISGSVLVDWVAFGT